MTIPESERLPTLVKWTASYFAHPYFAESDTFEEKQLPFQERDESCFHMTLQDNPPRPPSSVVGDTKEFYTTVDYASALRSDLAYMTIDPPRLQKISEDSLLLKAGDLDDQKDISFIVLCGTASFWPIIWGVWHLEEDVKRWKSEGKRMRPIEFSWLKGANHLVRNRAEK